MEDTLAPHDALKLELIRFDVLKVWSVLVTILGDLAPGERDEIPGPFLSAVTSRMGIKPEALRVAIHRLKNDGWVDSRKSGRVRHYQLSAHGRLETQMVRDRVYGKATDRAGDWHLVLTEAGHRHADALDWIKIRDGAFLVAQYPGPSKDQLVSRLNSEQIPIWVLDAICPKDIKTSYEKLAVMLSKFDPADVPETPIDQVTLRLLVLHAWRRLILRSNVSAVSAILPEWPGAQTAALVHNLLAHLPRPSLDGIAR
ncbi:MAG: hypothetical protein AAF393_11120 [Pseudomonadota bacterium]